MATAIETNPVEAIDPDRGYTYDEVAVWLRVTPRQVKRWVSEGLIGYVPVGKGRRILGRHYLEFISSSSVAAREADER